MRYLTVDQVLQINRSLFRSDDGQAPEVYPDHGRLDAAVMRPQASAGGEDAYPDIHTKVAALMHSLARNHAFLDGNKRTALLAAFAFYAINGWVLALDEGEAVGIAVDVAEGYIDVDRLAAELKNNSYMLDLPEE